VFSRLLRIILPTEYGSLADSGIATERDSCPSRRLDNKLGDRKCPREIRKTSGTVSLFLSYLVLIELQKVALFSCGVSIEET